MRRPNTSEGAAVAKSDTIQLPEKGTELFDTSEKVFPDVKAEPGETAYTFMHTVPYEGSVGLVNLLTTTRILRKGFKTHLVLYGPGVLMASGYIAGGAIAGIIIAFLAGVLTDFDNSIGKWAAASNPFFGGAAADPLALLPFALLTLLLWMVGREMLLGGRKPG